MCPPKRVEMTTCTSAAITEVPILVYMNVGRSIVIHRDEDDLGTVGDAGSMATGNAGARLGCGVVAIATTSVCDLI